MSTAAAPDRGIAVSLTPAALEADSRAFRIANSLAEIGFRSIVIEGRPSAPRSWGEKIEVRSVGRSGGGVPTAKTGDPWWRRAVSMLRDGQLGTAGEAALYCAFRGYDWWRHCHRPARLMPRASLVYLHSFELYRAVVPMAARGGARVVYDAHDFYRGIEPTAARRSFDRNRLRPFLDAVEDRVVADADAVVTVSDGVARLMEDTFGRRPTVIRNCHDERLDRTHAPDLRTMLGLRADDRLSVVVGNWKPGMAVATAVAALAQLPRHFHLAFVGRGYERVRDVFERADVRGRAHFGIVLSPDAIVPAIRSADVGLVVYEPYSENYRSALPNGFFQVVAAGLPLVRLPLPEIEAVIAGRPIGVCLDQADPESLAQAILHCSGDGSGRENAAALAREVSWVAETGRLRRLIDGLFAVRADGAARSARPFISNPVLAGRPGSCAE